MAGRWKYGQVLKRTQKMLEEGMSPTIRVMWVTLVEDGSLEDQNFNGIALTEHDEPGSLRGRISSYWSGYWEPDDE